MSAPPKVLLLGANGQLGCALRERFANWRLTAADRTVADFARPELLRSLVREVEPALILNAAAYTAVDRAETESGLAETINHKAVRILGEEAERAGSLLMHYSTDYVFDGTKQGCWVETDSPNPLNVYGATKLAGEQALAEVCGRYVTLRTSWVYGARGHNFLRTMLRLGSERDVLCVVDDQEGAPTSVDALAGTTAAIVTQLQDTRGSEWRGIYHATCGGRASWCGFAQAILSRAAKQSGETWAPVRPILTSEYPTPARRPLNSVLSNAKLHERFDVALPQWEEALQAVMSNLDHLLGR